VLSFVLFGQLNLLHQLLNSFGSLHVGYSGAPWIERVLAWVLMPFLRRIVYNAMYCNKPCAKENSLKIVQEVFQEVFISFSVRTEVAVLTCVAVDVIYKLP
jgi:hypothetical protein